MNDNRTEAGDHLAGSDLQVHEDWFGRAAMTLVLSLVS